MFPILKDMGYIEMALNDFEQCLLIDPGYLNCSQHQAEALLALGEIEVAVSQFEATMEHNFHSTDPAFKKFVNTHLMAYWQENGFPAQCRVLEDGDFA